MSSALQANDLAERLDRALPPYEVVVPDVTTVDDPVLAVAIRLAQGPHPVLSESLQGRIEARVLARAEQMTRRAWQSRRSAGLFLRTAVAACLVLAVIVVSTATASASSLPGDTLYPVKRLVESGRLALAGDSGELDLRLDFADRRLDEFEELLDRGEVHLDTLDDALDDMETTLRLIERGVGAVDRVAGELVALSQRHMVLAEQARGQVGEDQTKEQRLRDSATEAAVVGERAREFAAPDVDGTEPQSRTFPEEFQAYAARRSLARATGGERTPDASSTDAPPDEPIAGELSEPVQPVVDVAAPAVAEPVHKEPAAPSRSNLVQVPGAQAGDSTAPGTSDSEDDAGETTQPEPGSGTEADSGASPTTVTNPAGGGANDTPGAETPAQSPSPDVPPSATPTPGDPGRVITGDEDSAPTPAPDEATPEPEASPSPVEPTPAPPEPTAEPTEEPGEADLPADPTAEPADEATPEPAEPTPAPPDATAEPTADPSVDPTAEPVDEATPEPAEPAPAPPEPTAEPTEEPGEADQSTDPTAEPVDEATLEPAEPAPAAGTPADRSLSAAGDHAAVPPGGTPPAGPPAVQPPPADARPGGGNSAAAGANAQAGFEPGPPAVDEMHGAASPGE
jgi:hypothetical protein